MRIKHILKNLILLITTLLILLLLMNYFLVFNLKQKYWIFENSNLNSNSLTYLQNVLWPDVYENFKDEYILLIGDSYIFGNGDSRINGDYNYSVAHLLHSNSKLNIFNAGFGGNDSFTSVKYTFYLYGLIKNSFFLNKRFNDPEKIIFFFYEGNDIQGNLKHFKYLESVDENKCNAFHKKISFSDWFLESNFVGLKFLYFSIRHQMNINVQKGHLVNLLKLILDKNTYAKLEKKYGKKDPQRKTINKIIFKNNTILTGYMQFPPFHISEKKIDNSFKVLDISLKCLTNKFNEQDIYFVYIPSPASLYNSDKGQIKVKSHLPYPTYYYPTYYPSLNFKKLSKKFEHKANSIARNNHLKIIGITSNLEKISKKQLIHGPIDIHHFNRLGYKLLAENLIENIK